MQKLQEDYEKKRKKKLDETIQTLTDASAVGQRAIRQVYGQKMQKIGAQYDGLFDRNAIREAVSKKSVAERMANLGLTNSGLNRSEQTAIATTRAKADAKTAEDKQLALNELNAELARALADGEIALADRKADATEAAESDIQKTLSTLISKTASENKSGGSSGGGSSGGSSAKGDDYLEYLKTYIGLLQNVNTVVNTPNYVQYQGLMKLLRQKVLGY